MFFKFARGAKIKTTMFAHKNRIQQRSSINKPKISLKILNRGFKFQKEQMKQFLSPRLNKCKPFEKSNRNAMNRNWSNQKPNPAIKTKTGDK